MQCVQVSSDEFPMGPATVTQVTVWQRLSAGSSPSCSAVHNEQTYHFNALGVPLPAKAECPSGKLSCHPCHSVHAMQQGQDHNAGNLTHHSEAVPQALQLSVCNNNGSAGMHGRLVCGSRQHPFPRAPNNPSCCSSCQHVSTAVCKLPAQAQS
jgi:hypothetical protein